MRVGTPGYKASGLSNYRNITATYFLQEAFLQKFQANLGKIISTYRLLFHENVHHLSPWKLFRETFLQNRNRMVDTKESHMIALIVECNSKETKQVSR